jgi:AcrR family transcriptional regulator
MARPQLTSVEVSATRARLTALAVDLYVKEGLAALSFRRLADMAGISHTLPYRYFEHKEALLVAVRVECMERFNRFVREREVPTSAPAQRLRNIARAYVEFVGLYPDEYEMILSTHQPPPDRYPDLMAACRNFFDHAIEAVQEGIDSGLLRGDARRLTHLFWVSLHGLTILHVSGQLVHGCGVDELVEPLMQRLISGVERAAVELQK